MNSPSPSSWPATRRKLIVVAIVLGGLMLCTLVVGRPEDFAAGFVGMVLGIIAALVVLVVEAVGRVLTCFRRERQLDGSVEASSESDAVDPR
jgi:hypothetical protein